MAAVKFTASLQRSGLSPVGSAAPLAGVCGCGPGEERSVVDLVQVLVLVVVFMGEGKQATVGGADSQEEAGHEAALEQRERSRLLVIGREGPATCDGKLCVVGKESSESKSGRVFWMQPQRQRGRPLLSRRGAQVPEMLLWLQPA